MEIRIGNHDMSDTVNIVGASLHVFIRNGDKAKALSVPLDQKQQRSVLNFVQHRIHGGRLKVAKPEEEKLIITL